MIITCSTSEFVKPFNFILKIYDDISLHYNELKLHQRFKSCMLHLPHFEHFGP